MNEQEWKQDLNKKEKEWQDSLVELVLKNERWAFALKPFSSSLGQYLLTAVWTSYMNCDFKWHDSLAVYLLRNSKLVNKTNNKLTAQGKSIFKEYFQDIIFKRSLGQNWEEESKRRIKEYEEAIKYEGKDYINERLNALAKGGFEGLERYFSNVEKLKKNPDS